MTLNRAFDNFMMNRRLKGSTDKTLTNYADFNRKFLAFAGDMELEQLTIETVYEYLLSFRNRTLSQATISTYTRHIKAFLHWASDEYKLGFPYEKIIIPKARKKDIYLYNADEIRLIFDTVNAYPEWLKYRNYCLISLMLDSGLRQSELTTIRIKDIDYTLRTVKVLGKGCKERKVPLGELSARLINRYRNECPYENDYLFCEKSGKQLTANTVKKMVSKMAKKLPFEFSSHKLRHNFATNYCIDQYHEKGIMDPYSLMTILGHEDMETTMRYIHLANEIISCQSNISHLDRIFPDLL